MKMNKDDLFRDRIDVGKRLEAIIKSRKLTKKALCDLSHISRPTLDKLLSGRIESKSSFDKQLNKIILALEINHDELVTGNVFCGENNVKSFRMQLGISQKDLAVASGIPIKTIQAVENGSVDLLDSEWTDLAIALKSDSRSLKRENFLPSQYPYYDYALKEIDSSENLSGYQGYILITPVCGQTEFSFALCRHSWNNAMSDLLRAKYVVVPCLGNKLILINVKNNRKYEFLDDDYDNFDGHYSFFNTLPLEDYYLLDKHFGYMAGDMELKLPDRHEGRVCWILDSSSIDSNEIEKSIHSIIIHYSDGNSETIWIDNYAMAAALIQRIYFDEDCDEDLIAFGVNDEAETNNLLVNLNAISFIEFPLLRIEEALHSEE